MRARPVLALTAAAIAAATTIAAAQSKRYPAPARDAEAEAERKSDFWEEVVRPGAGRYDALVRGAAQIIRVRSGDLARARDQLKQATALRGDLPAAWGYLGVASESLHDYKACAEAYGKAHALAPAWKPTLLAEPADVVRPGRTAATRSTELAWAVCLAHAGDHAASARVLEAMVARGETGVELFETLGQVHMATGRIADAITALSRAIDERPDDVTAKWLRVVAYDRARRTGDVAVAIESLAMTDVRATRASSSPVPFVPPADSFYLLGVANLDRPAQTLAYFRTYLDLAPEKAPWRSRAQDHLDAAATGDLADGTTLEGVGDLKPIKVAVRGAMPALRACMTEIPSVLIELRVTEVGPISAPQVGRRPPRSRVPEAQSPGSHAALLIAYDVAGREAQVDRAVDCVEKVGLGLSLPRPPPDSYSTIRIPVIAAAP